MIPQSIYDQYGLVVYLSGVFDPGHPYRPCDCGVPVYEGVAVSTSVN